MTNDEISAYYVNCYNGERIDPADFPRLFSRAEENLQMLTMGKLYTLPEVWGDTIKRALCAQIEYLHMAGVETATLGDASGGFTVGHVSVSGPSGGNSGGDAGASVGISPRARQILFPTGLLYRGVVMLC